MPRIRSIKPDFFKSRAVRKLTDREKLVWIGLWIYSDDSGRHVDEPAMLVGELWALGISNEKQMDAALAGLVAKGRIRRYVVNGDGFIQVLGWQHQKISNPTDSEIPPEPLANDSVIAHESIGLEGKGRERKGGEAPPLFCMKHPSGTDAPCRACADCRRAHEAWLLEQKNKPTPTTPVRLDPNDGHEHEKHPTENYCLRCDEVMA